MTLTKELVCQKLVDAAIAYIDPLTKPIFCHLDNLLQQNPFSACTVCVRNKEEPLFERRPGGHARFQTKLLH